MQEYFDDVQPLETPGFLRKFRKHINARSIPDPTDEVIFQKLKESASRLSCYRGNLNELGARNLILPHHAAHQDGLPDPDREVQTGGKSFYDVRDDYRDRYIPNARFP